MTPHTVWVGGPPVVFVGPPSPPRRKSPQPNACKTERNAFIFERRNRGDKYQDIALQAGISASRCQEIVNKIRRAA